MKRSRYRTHLLRFASQPGMIATSILFAAAALSSQLSGLTAVACAADSPAASETAAKPTSPFLRLLRDDRKSPVALETSIVRYRPAKESDASWSVDLVAALHIGEKSYYAQLNRELASYDAVLYELVADDKRNVPQPGESGGNHPLSLFQNAMKDMLGLEFQLKGIDYTRKNMVHADMSPEEFAQSMQDRGESVPSMFLRMLGYAMAHQDQSNDALSAGQFLMALLDKNRALAMKRIMAEEFANSDGSLAALDGPNGSTLIVGRNQVALRVLREQKDAGRKTMAIFYGAGHMPDMQKRLHDDFGLEPVSTRWLVAWDLKSPPMMEKTPINGRKSSNKTAKPSR